MPIALSGDSGTALREMFSLSNEEMPSPQALPLVKRLAVRQHLLETGTGAEVVLSLIDGQPTLHLASRVTIAEMELSVRAYNCLTAASIRTLDELLSWEPSELMELAVSASTRSSISFTSLAILRLATK
jgi:DNA-directed RNA polymerase alpha subunit